VLLEATASASSSGRSITQVEFFAGTTLIGAATAAPYSFAWGNVAAGSYSLTARATDNLGVASTSAPVAILVNAPPAVGLTDPANGAVFTAPATIDLAATAADTDGTIAQVEFFQGATLLATVATPPYTTTLNNVAAGVYSFTARATDNQGATTTSTAVAVTVNAPPTVSLTSPANNATFTAPADITITANAQDTDGSIAMVEFFEGANLIATRTTPPYSIVWTGVPAGSYSLTARVTDNLGASVTSAAVSVTVNTGAATMYFIHPDHLNTPRRIYNQGQQLVWAWEQSDPFGGNVPDENPSGLGAFTCNLRLPGQYFDRETNTHYNYFRDYDPAIGRYGQSDPIGLDGGINTFTYVRNNPTGFVDPLGLDSHGCGAGPFYPVIPNNPFGFAFKECCDAHDNCYDDCKNLPTKQQCDDTACACFSGKCNKYTGGVKWTCQNLASTYCDKATKTGQSQKSFDDSRKKCIGPRACISSSNKGS